MRESSLPAPWENRFHSLGEVDQVREGPLRRVVLIGENIELRIVSLVVRCREVAEDVVLFDTGPRMRPHNWPRKLTPKWFTMRVP